MNSETRNATATSDRSPPDSSDSRLIFLPGGRASTSTPVVSQLSGSVSSSRPSPPGKSREKTRAKACSTSAYASAKTCSTRWSTSAMRSSRSLRVRCRSSSWVERNWWRSSRALNSSSANGLTRPSTARSAVAARNRFCCCSRTYAMGSGGSSSAPVSTGMSWSGP